MSEGKTIMAELSEAEGEIAAATIHAREKQYAVYVEWAERLIERRAEANRFYVALNLAIVGAIGFLFSDHFGGATASLAPWIAMALAFAGIIVSHNWRSVIRSQRRIMAWKFDIIHKLEETLPLQPYKDEWELSGEDRRRSPAGRFELRLPMMFMLFFLLVVAIAAVHGLGVGIDDIGSLIEGMRGGG